MVESRTTTVTGESWQSPTPASIAPAAVRAAMDRLSKRKNYTPAPAPAKPANEQKEETKAEAEPAAETEPAAEKTPAEETASE